MTGMLGRVVGALWPRSNAEVAVERWAAGVPEPLVGEDPFMLWRCDIHGLVGPCAQCMVDEPVPAALVAAGSAPAGERIPQTMPPAGRTAELVELISDVLLRYVDEFGAILSYERVDDVAKGIADRLQRAASTASFTFSDLAEAAYYASFFSLHATRPRQAASARALAARLGAAADAHPTP